MRRYRCLRFSLPVFLIQAFSCGMPRFQSQAPSELLVLPSNKSVKDMLGG